MITVKRYGRIAVSVAAALILASGQMVFSTAQAAAIQFDIESQPLAKALNTWANQSGLQVIWPAGDPAAYVNSASVQGSLEPMDALRVLLEGTGLSYSVIGSGKTVAIHGKERRVGLQGTASVTGVAGDGPPAVRVAAGKPAGGEASESSREGSGASSEGHAEKKDVEELQEIVVTGTHIRGAVPAGSKVIVIDRQALTDSGYSTVQDVLKTLPQNFSGGVTEDNVPDASVGNLNYGSAINLRGLGADSTLVLVNGQRQASGGFTGSFVDVSSIAISAIERIEVLPDGASAIYGSDAVGGVVNIILRRDFRGAETNVSMGTLDGDAADMRASQLSGTAWERGNGLLGYQYAKRESLGRSDRSYTSSDDFRRFGGSDFRSIGSNPGNIFDPFTFQPILAIPSGQDGTDLGPEDFIPIGPDEAAANRHSLAEQGDLLPEQESHTAFIYATQRLADQVDVSLDARYSKRRTEVRRSGMDTIGLLGGGLQVGPTNPFFPDPFGDGSPVFVTYNFLDDVGPVTERTETNTYAATLSAVLDVTPSWRVSASGGYARESAESRVRNIVHPRLLNEALGNLPEIDDPSTSYNPTIDGFFNPFADGGNSPQAVIEAIRYESTEESRSSQTSANVLAEGPLFGLPAGDVRAAAGGSYRSEKLDTTFDFTVPMSRDVAAAFAELAIPLKAAISDGKAGRLDISVAARYEDYSDFGDTFDPRVGLTWTPTESIGLRTSWGTSFRAPRLVDTLDAPGIGANLAVAFPLADPQSVSPDGTSLALLVTGGNSELKPETATTWTAGIDFTPPNLGDLSISFTYFNINYEDRIAQGGPAGDPFSVLLQEDVWSSIITRNPSQVELESICNGPLFLDFGFDCSASDVIVDLRIRNLAVVKVNGLDVDLRSGLETSLGDFDFGIAGSYVFDFKRAVTESSPEIDIVDTLGNVPALRLRGTVSWSKGEFGVTIIGNHTGAYINDIDPTRRNIGSYSTVDLGGTWRATDGLQFGLHAVNVFDRMPPFVNTQYYGYDTANADLYGRILSATVTKKW